MSKPIQIGIIGGSGYVAGELLRILVNHPDAVINYVQSKTHHGKLVSAIHNDLEGECDLVFKENWEPGADLVLLCGGHQQSNLFLSKNTIPIQTKIIDLSQDFRLGASKYSYGREFIYGLPEQNKSKIRAGDSIANPGCFATAITLSLIPVIDLIRDDIHIHAITGSTGSGQSLSATTNFNWRNGNISVYKAFSHQHLDEINETLREVFPAFCSRVNFIPMRGNFTRGIFTTLYFKSDLSAEELIARFQTRYEQDPFVRVTEKSPGLKQVLNTNKIIIHPSKHGDQVLITSVLDNLLKGAAGQAVQNMNLLFGLDECAGLKLKSIAF